MVSTNTLKLSLVLLFLTCFAFLWFEKTYVKNILSYTIYYEDWDSIKDKKFNWDYSWLGNIKGQIIIAHALGFAGSKKQNTLEAYVEAANAGFKYFEVDLWLDKEGVIQCHHGPDVPKSVHSPDCTFDVIQKKVCSEDNYLILDIKTDFKKTVTAIEPYLGEHQSKCVIFQLYRPSEISLFDHLQRKYKLRGAIYTYYLTRRNIEFVSFIVYGAGIRAMTVPITAQLTDIFAKPGFSIFTHPVDSCNSLFVSRQNNTTGIYTTVDFIKNKLSNCELPN